MSLDLPFRIVRRLPISIVTVCVGHVVPEGEVKELVAAAAPDKEEAFRGFVEKAHVPEWHKAEPPEQETNAVVVQGEQAAFGEGEDSAELGEKAR